MGYSLKNKIKRKKYGCKRNIKTIKRWENKL